MTKKLPIFLSKRTTRLGGRQGVKNRRFWDDLAMEGANSETSKRFWLYCKIYSQMLQRKCRLSVSKKYVEWEQHLHKYIFPFFSLLVKINSDLTTFWREHKIKSIYSFLCIYVYSIIAFKRLSCKVLFWHLQCIKTIAWDKLSLKR